MEQKQIPAAQIALAGFLVSFVMGVSVGAWQRAEYDKNLAGKREKLERARAEAGIAANPRELYFRVENLPTNTKLRWCLSPDQVNWKCSEVK